MEKIRRIFKDNVSVIAVFLLIVILMVLLLFNRIVIFIGAGEAGVLYRLFFGGTVVTKVYPEGIHFIWPWDSMNIYNVRVQQKSHEFDVLTKNGLKIKLAISVRYYPQYKLVGVLHKNIGPNYVNVFVIPEIENVLRVLIGRLDAEEVYTTKQSIIEKSISEAIEQIAQRYVNVDDVIIKRIYLPSNIEKAIQQKVEKKHQAAAYEFILEKEAQEKTRKQIESEGLKILQLSLSPEVLHWMGIQATLKLAESSNSKVVIIGSEKNGLPIIGSIPLNPFPVELSDSQVKQLKSNIQTEPQPENLSKNIEPLPNTQPAPKTSDIKETQQAQTPESAQSTENVQSSESAQSSESSESSESAQSTDSAQNAESAQSTESAQSAQSTESAESSQAVIQNQETEPEKDKPYDQENTQEQKQ